MPEPAADEPEAHVAEVGAPERLGEGVLSNAVQLVVALDDRPHPRDPRRPADRCEVHAGMVGRRIEVVEGVVEPDREIVEHAGDHELLAIVVRPPIPALREHERDDAVHVPAVAAIVVAELGGERVEEGVDGGVHLLVRHRLTAPLPPARS